jgi:hypothetical protein
MATWTWHLRLHKLLRGKTAAVTDPTSIEAAPLVFLPGSPPVKSHRLYPGTTLSSLPVISRRFTSCAMSQFFSDNSLSSSPVITLRCCEKDLTSHEDFVEARTWRQSSAQDSLGAVAQTNDSESGPSKKMPSTGLISSYHFLSLSMISVPSRDLERTGGL